MPHPIVLLLACSTPEAPVPQALPPAAPVPAAAPAAAPEVAPAAAATTRLDLNTATSEQFAAIPGVGAKMVHEFEEYRPYVSITQFRKEMGKYVDAAKIAEYENHVYVPIDPATSDAATIRQIPGVDAAEADQLVAGRPWTDRQAFLDALAKHVSPEELAVAQAWVVAPR